MRKVLRERTLRMALRAHTFGMSSRARLTWLTWLALMGLILGTFLRAFNPFDAARDRPELMKENRAMNTSMDITAPVAETRPKDGLIPSKIETATFAMG